MTAEDIYYLKFAYNAATQSGDLSTQNGAVLVAESGRVAVGWNDIYPKCCDTPERRQRPLKYQWTEHAERSAIYNAARLGIATQGSTLYCPWLACADCGRAIVISGIDRVVRHKIPQHSERPDWLSTIAMADEMMRATGVVIDEYEGFLSVKFRFDGREIEV